MHPKSDTNEDPMAAMTQALARMCENFDRAKQQAEQLGDVMERMPPAHARRATEQIEGTSYVQVLHRTIRGLDEMGEAYRALRTTILRRSSGLDAGRDAGGERPAPSASPTPAP